MSDVIKIRPIKDKEIESAIELTWDTFLKYEAIDYEDEEISEFRKVLSDRNWINSNTMLGAFENNKLVGVIATPDFEHINLLYIDEDYQGRNIEKNLIRKVSEFNDTGYLTANVSPYSKKLYERLGFKVTHNIEVINGLRRFRMKYEI